MCIRDRRYATEFVLKLLKKRLFSSPAAFLRTLDQHRQTVEGLRPAKRPRRAPTDVLRRLILEAEEGEAEDDEEVEATSESALGGASATFAPLGAEERLSLIHI